ncbi:M23 family metallopeptidase [Aureitalea marina]|uniref:M23 family metallopeptidase n=1 Tax=Aureitalea marina TaxID=930804 RepID=UPI001FEAFD52|nr:peptidoglycan DD-metalloendopeptidase family protein [Aureitalea marina]
MKLRVYALLFALVLIVSCSKETKEDDTPIAEPEPTPQLEYGYDLNDYLVLRDTVSSGDTFGAILDANGVTQNIIYQIATTYKDSFDVRKLVVGKPFTILKSKDSLEQTQVFIYEKNRVEYVVIDLRDEISLTNMAKPVTMKTKEASGVITSSLYETMVENDLSPYMSDRLATIYAWTINFFKIQAGDRFRVVYTERFINDSISVGLGDIQAAYFEHKGRELYAFKFYPEDGDEKISADFYDEEANNLRRAFLQSPLKFGRLSSRYNLKRRIAYYGNKVRPHKGTDFAAPVGTEILATADGTVTKSERRGGNGNYVKIRHNGTYETQYLHMRSRNVKVGDYVRQGDVIGWIGMTGNTAGPHVCYRFWKNGKQVDPFLQDLPASEPLAEQYHNEYYTLYAAIEGPIGLYSVLT